MSFFRSRTRDPLPSAAFHVVVSLLVLFGCDRQQQLYEEDGMKTINGTQLYYKILGAGEPIVILHGGPGLNHSYFLPQMAELAKTHRLIFFDQRLCGRSASDVDSSEISMHHFVEDVEGIRKAFALNKMNLMAHSWGGVLAMFYARTYPENLKSLILVNTTAASSELQQQAGQLSASRFTKADSLARAELMQSEAFKRRESSALEELFRITFRTVFHDRDLVHSLTLKLPPNFAANNAKLRVLFKDLAGFDLHPDLAKITCPSLIIHGASDIYLQEALDKIREGLPHSKFVLLQRAGHFPFIETPEAFFRQVRSFIDDLPDA